MKRTNKFFGIILLLILESCYFGAGLVEREITENYFLFANNTLEEMSVWYQTEKNKNQVIIPETVFAVGKNQDFIIAKSHPKNIESGINKNITYYHIIELDNKSIKLSPNFTLKQFEKKRKELNIPKDLDFSIVYEELK